VHTGNKPGALFRILEPLEKLGISLTKIETRPSKIEAWEYVFFMDFEGHKEDSKVLNLFSQLKTCTAEIKVLGSYPRFGSES
jgi:chorismate mutase/prephenate dehydratase